MTSTALIFNKFVNEIFGNLFYETFGRSRYFFWFLTKKNSKNVYFLLENRHLKSTIDYENNGKWKLQTCFSPNYDFAFKNLFKNATEMSYKDEIPVRLDILSASKHLLEIILATLNEIEKSTRQSSSQWRK